EVEEPVALTSDRGHRSMRRRGTLRIAPGRRVGVTRHAVRRRRLAYRLSILIPCGSPRLTGIWCASAPRRYALLDASEIGAPMRGRPRSRGCLLSAAGLLLDSADCVENVSGVHACSVVGVHMPRSNDTGTVDQKSRGYRKVPRSVRVRGGERQVE